MTVRIVPTQFLTITAAVTASSPGDTIRILSGTFTESVTIGAGKDRLTIIGEGPGETIINADGGPVFTIAAMGSTQVTIQGLTAQNTPAVDSLFTAGIVVETDSNVIRDVEVRNSGGFGIGVTNGNLNLIANCNVHDNFAAGIIVSSPFPSDNNYVIKCKVKDNDQDGIRFDSKNNLALENTCNNNRFNGIQILGDNNLLIKNKCMGNGSNGINLLGPNNNNAVIQNECDENNENGIRIAFAANGHFVFENKVNENIDDGIELLDADQNRIIGNDVENSGDRGIEVIDEAVENVVDENDIEDSTNAGIFVSGTSDNNTIRRNELDDNNPDIDDQGAGNVIDENETD